MDSNNHNKHKYIRVCVVIKFHDDQAEGLCRRDIVKMIQTASVKDITYDQAARCWDRTVHQYGRDAGLLTGYVKPQAGSSKRTAAGSVDLQTDYYGLVTKTIRKIRQRAMEVLQDKTLVDLIIEWLVANLDEECLHALGKNTAVVGSKDKKKHDNQNASSRFVANLFGSCQLLDLLLANK